MSQKLPFLEEDAFIAGKEPEPQLISVILPLKERELIFKKVN